MNRPKHTDVPLRAVAAQLAPDVAKLVNCAPDDEEIIDALEDALKRVGCSNGYEIAKELERSSIFRPDSMLVEILDSAWYVRSTLHDELVKKWVSWHDITSDKNVGDPVRISFRVKDVRGTIRRINHEHAQYVVYAEELFLDRKGGGRHLGMVINYEDILPA